MTLEERVNLVLAFLSNSAWSGQSEGFMGGDLGQGDVEPVFRSRRSAYHHDYVDQEEYRSQQSGWGN